MTKQPMRPDADPVPHVVRRGSGRAVLFLHGFGVDHRLLLGLDDIFAEGGWERIYVDLPGFGNTAPLAGRGGLPELAAWLQCAVEKLIGHASFAVVGASMGGLLARHLAARHPNRCLGLALLAPVMDPVHARRTLPQPQVLLADPDLVAGLDETEVEAYTELAVLQTRDHLHRFRSAVLPGLRVADEEAMGRIMAHYDLPEDPDVRLGDFTAPVLIVVGRQDAVVGYEDHTKLVAQLPRVTYAMLDYAGHNIHLDQPEVVSALLSAWAQQVSSPS